MVNRDKGLPHDCERCPLSDDDYIQQIAERAADAALERVYTNVGKSVVKSFLWLAGAATLAVTAWLNGAGHLKL